MNYPTDKSDDYTFMILFMSVLTFYYYYNRN